MSTADTFRFTVPKLAGLVPPETGERTVYDTESHLALRVRAGGSRRFIVRYQIGRGRGAPVKRHVIGDPEDISLVEARRIADDVVAKAREGIDVAEKMRAIVADHGARKDRSLAKVVSAYVEDLKSRQVVAAPLIESLLRRELVTPLGADFDTAALTRSVLVKRFNEIKTDRPGAARELKTRAHGLLNFAVGADIVTANPLAGLRAARKTRAEAIEAEDGTTGRLLSMPEIAALWRACADPSVPPAFGGYIRVLLLTGCRRGELASARVSWLENRSDGWWLNIPREVMKNARGHAVPLSGLGLDIIGAVPRSLSAPDIMFPGRGGTVEISGWSKTWPKLLKAATAGGLRGNLKIHDLRKSFRSHMTRLGVPELVAETLIAHLRRDPLGRTYDLFAFEAERREAIVRWTAEIEAAIGAAPSTTNVVPITERRRVRAQKP